MERLTSRSRAGSRLRLLAILAALAPLGCVSTKAPEQTGVMQAMGVDVSARRLRVGANNAAVGFMSEVELMADSVAVTTDDPRVRHNALAWKVHAIPAIQRAMYHPDPLISFADGWTLLVQMIDYFDTGGGRHLFGDRQDFVVTGLRDGEARLRAGVDRVVAEPAASRLDSLVYAFAAENPLTNDLYLRPSVTVAAAEVLGKERGGGFSSLGSMIEMAQDAQQMALVLASYTPKQVAWQSELLIAEMTDSTRLTPMLRAIDDMEVVSATTEFMRVTPDLIASERAAVFREIAEERLVLMEEISRLRDETLVQVAEMMAAERSAVLAEVARERVQVFQELQGLTEHAFDETRSLVDHLLLMMGVGLLGLAALVVIALAMLRGRSARTP